MIITNAMLKPILVLSMPLGLCAICLSQAIWKPFKFGTSFSVKTPAVMVPVKLSSELEAEKVLCWKGTAADVTYAVIVTPGDAKDLDTKEGSDQAQQGFVDTVTNGDLSNFNKQEEYLYNGWSGLKIGLDLKDRQTEIHNMVIGKAIVSLSVTDPIAADLTKTVDPFFTSFSVLDTVGKGKLTEPGPTWQPIPVKEDAFTYEIPGKPSGGVKDAKGRLQNHSNYLAEYFLCVSAHIPESVLKELPGHEKDVRGLIVNDTATSLGVVTCTPSEGKLGPDDATWADMVLADGRVAREAVVLHGGVMVSLLAICPKGLKQNPEMDHFFKSLEFVIPK